MKRYADIIVQKPTKVREWRLDKEHYVFFVSKKLITGWRQRRAFNYLLKTKALRNDSFMVESIDFVRLDPSDLVKSAHEQLFAIINAGHEPAHIYAGHEDIAQLHQQLDWKGQIIGINAPFEYATSKGPHRQPEMHLLDLPVTILPHMKGILVVPKSC